MIKNKAGEGTDYLKQRSTDIKQTASEWVDKGKEAIGRQKENIADAVDAGRQAYREAVGHEPATPGPIDSGTGGRLSSGKSLPTPPGYGPTIRSGHRHRICI